MEPPCILPQPWSDLAVVASVHPLEEPHCLSLSPLINMAVEKEEEETEFGALKTLLLELELVRPGLEPLLVRLESLGEGFRVTMRPRRGEDQEDGHDTEDAGTGEDHDSAD